MTAPGNFTHVPDVGWVWTTFYGYQWDLNWSNPEVFVEMALTMLRLANRGIEAFRLDSTAYLWKRLGTDCMNQPEAHAILQALRAVSDIVTPGVLLKAEAIVLRSLRFGEADRILHLYSLERGRINAIAKGVRKGKSRFGGRLEPLMRLRLVLHEGKSDLLTVTGVETVEGLEVRRTLRRGGRLVVNEVRGDPDYIKATDLDRLCREAGLRLLRRRRGRLRWTCVAEFAPD